MKASHSADYGAARPRSLLKNTFVTPPRKLLQVGQYLSLVVDGEARPESPLAASWAC
jgi:hypothetical protein